MEKTKIEEVMIFDDMECYENKIDFLARVNEILKRSFEDNQTLQNYEISQELKVNFFFIKDESYYQISEGDTVERQDNWHQKISDLFQQEKGYLILCDYQWKGEDADINKKIYDVVQNNSKIIFVVYTAAMFPEAQQWIDELVKEEHKCKIVDVLLSIPSGDMSGTFRSLEEAIWDEW